MSEYTKGPWKVDPDYPADIQTADGRMEIASTGKDVLRRKTPSRPQTHANAQLIATSPELLEALKALRSFMWAEGYADQTVEMAQADAAISKAEATNGN